MFFPAMMLFGWNALKFVSTNNQECKIIPDNKY